MEKPELVIMPEGGPVERSSSSDLLGHNLPSSLRLMNYPGQHTPERSEVLERSANEMDRQQELLEWAWAIIANASGGDWSKEPKEWQEAAKNWSDSFHS